MAWNAFAQRRLSDARDWWNGEDTVSQLYLSALIMASIAVLLLRWQPEGRASEVIVSVAFALFAIGYLWEAYNWIVPKLELPLVKVLLAALGVTAAAMATGVSRMIVNEATGQDPAYFGTTVALLVPLSFVPVVAVMVLVGGLILLPATMLWMLVHSFRSWTTDADRVVLFGCARAFATLVIVGFATSLLQPSSPLFPVLGRIAKHSAHVFDGQSDSACAIENNDRALRINDDLIILSRLTADGPQFVRHSCALASEDKPLMRGVSSMQSQSAPLTVE